MGKFKNMAIMASEIRESDTVLFMGRYSAKRHKASIRRIISNKYQTMRRCKLSSDKVAKLKEDIGQLKYLLNH